MSDRDVIRRFRDKSLLPSKYGYRLDERVIELPWVLARLNRAETMLLDAGSALNHDYLLSHEALERKTLVIVTLAPEQTFPSPSVSYLYGDLRKTIIKSDCFDEIVSISTLEHVGMNNTLLYTKDQAFDESSPLDFEAVIVELKRLLKPGGRLFITVPYGVYENHGWLQQFDRAMVERVQRVFDGSSAEVSYYRYNEDGWNISTAEACADCRYFDIHRKSDYDPDYAAAARAVACLELVK
ncbi:MAG: class I SAM-dependent methyltransferase [Syntrophaceae bacterium]|nr:class I SAM-dependent methyltransferase [Syntrophaceae bacterium]